MKTITAFAAAAVSATLLASAAAAASFTSAYFFGDSLTDPGNLYADTGKQMPLSPPYFEGRFSNGRVWAEHIADDFTAKGLSTANFAYGGATALESDGFPPDLPDQIDGFSDSGALLGRRPVATLWFGSNDILNAINAPAPSLESVGTTAVNAAGAVGYGIGQLADIGVRDVVVLNLAPMQLTPQFNLFAPPEAAALAKFGADTFNATLKSIVAGIGGSRVRTIDIHAALTDLVADPQKYGVSDAVNPCFDRVNPPCSPDEALQRAFFDPVHPNSVVHGDIADLVRAKVAPVPLPAPLVMLIAALAGLGAVRYRRRA